jgi:cobalt/nickel transport system permease protein
MHVPDGILPAGACLAGYGVAIAASAASLAVIGRRPDPHRTIPRASIFTAAFFVASWIHVPLPPTSVHLLLNGLLGVVLGPFAFLAIGIGLFFQAVMFQHGGLTTLGANATIIGLPAVLVGAAFRSASPLWKKSRAWAAVLAFAAGAGGIGLAAVAFALLLVSVVPPEIDPSLGATGVAVLVAGHVPLALVEGLLTMLVVLFFRQVQPELLEG